MAELALEVDHVTKRFRLHQQKVSSLKQLVATRGRRGDTTDFTALENRTKDAGVASARRIWGPEK